MISGKLDEAKYLKERLEDQIDWYDRKSISNQKSFKRLQVLIIVASATIPFLSGKTGRWSVTTINPMLNCLFLVCYSWSFQHHKHFFPDRWHCCQTGYLARFSDRRPWIRSNWRVLFVTIIASRANAWVAIMASSAPIGTCLRKNEISEPSAPLDGNSAAFHHRVKEASFCFFFRQNIE